MLLFVESRGGIFSDAARRAAKQRNRAVEPRCIDAVAEKKSEQVMPGKINEHSFAESCFEGLPKSLRFSSYSYVLSSYDLA